MLFDKLCGIAETHLRPLLPVLREARIFEFPYAPHTVLSKDLTPEDLKCLQDQLFLPFSTVAVEDKASCILLWDSVANQSGCGQRRFFVECLPYFPEDMNAFDISVEGKARESLQRALCAKAAKIKDASDACVVIVGSIDKLVSATTSSFAWTGAVGTAFVATKDRVLVSNDTLMKGAGAAGADTITEMSVRNASVAIQEILMMNSPDRFIVERTTDGVRKAEKKPDGKVLRRSHERPVYTLLTPHQIREKLSATGTGSPVSGHERRRHFRTLKSDRFVNAQGKVLTIPATWVGPSEVTIKRTHYRVCLEL